MKNRKIIMALPFAIVIRALLFICQIGKVNANTNDAYSLGVHSLSSGIETGGQEENLATHYL